MSKAKRPASMSIDEIRTAAASVAQQLTTAGAGPLPKDVRGRFIAVRAALFQRGVFDPVLVRFDSATVPPATPSELAGELTKIAAAL